MLYLVQGVIFSLIAIAVLTVIIMIRNEMVFKYRGELLNKIHSAILRDIWNPDIPNVNNKWRYDAYHSVSYNEMVLKFWKRLDSFYPDKSFLE